MCRSCLGRGGGEPTANIPEQAKASIHGKAQEARACRSARPPLPVVQKQGPHVDARHARRHRFHHGLANTSTRLSLWTASGRARVRSHPWRKPAAAAAGFWSLPNRRSGCSCSPSQSVSPRRDSSSAQGLGGSRPRSFRGQSRVAETRDCSFDKRRETSAMARLECRGCAQCHCSPLDIQ